MKIYTVQKLNFLDGDDKGFIINETDKSHSIFDSDRTIKALNYIINYYKNRNGISSLDREAIWFYDEFKYAYQTYQWMDNGYGLLSSRFLLLSLRRVPLVRLLWLALATEWYRGYWLGVYIWPSKDKSVIRQGISAYVNKKWIKKIIKKNWINSVLLIFYLNLI